MRGRRTVAGICRLFLCLSLSAGSAPVLAQGSEGNLRLDPEVAAAAFGMRETVIDASLSPDGTKLATVQPNGARGSVVLILDLANPESAPVPIVPASGEPERLRWCRWVSNERLVCQLYLVTYINQAAVFSGVSRLLAVDIDGDNLQFFKLPGSNNRAWGFKTFGGAIIDWNPGKDGHVLVINRYFPEFSTGTRISSDQEGVGLDDVDTGSMRLLNIEKPKDKVWEFVTDGHGNLRVMGIDIGIAGSGYSAGNIRYAYRKKGSNEWLELGRYEAVSQEGFNPYYVDPQLDVVYGLRKRDGRQAAFSIALDGSRKETLLLDKPDVDVAGFVTIGRNQRVIGIRYTTDRDEVDYFDPKIKALAKALAAAMPELPLIRIIDSSEDEKKLLIWASSDTNAGRYFVLDRATSSMEEVAAARQNLDPVALSRVQAISFTAADGTKIPAYLTLPPGSDRKNLPAIVIPHGGPSARDKWGFDWLAQFWAQIGYAVIQPNYRGSAGYGDQWFQENGIRSWKVAIGDVSDAGRWLVDQGIADPDKLAIFGWSYGGYAALQSGVVAPDLFKAIVAVAPVTDFERLREDHRDWSDYEMVSSFIGTGPHVEEGSPARNAGRIMAPVLIFHGMEDLNVDVNQSRIMAERLRDAGKAVELKTYDKLDHALDDSLVRREMLLTSAQFVAKAIGRK